MNSKKSLILTISIIAGSLVLFLIISFLLGGTYRNQLPGYPDFKSMSGSLQKQISAAGRKAYFNPSGNNIGELGKIYYSCGDNVRARQCFRLAIRKDKSNWIWCYYLGYLNLESGETEASIENFRNVIEKDPANYMAMFYLAEGYKNLGRDNDAENLFKGIASRAGNPVRDTLRESDFPLETYALFRLAGIYMNSNHLDTAEIVLKKIINNQMTFGPAYRMLGNVYSRKGNAALGDKYIIRANDLVQYASPSDLLVDNIALISRSDNYLLKEIDDAMRSLNFKWELKLFDQALKYNTQNKYLISKALFGYFILGFDKKALPYLDQHFTKFSDDFNELYLMASILAGKGYKSQAMNYFNQSKKIEPLNSRLVLWLHDRNMLPEALILMDEQLKRDPENIKILSDAVRLYSILGQKRKATTYFNDIERLIPKSPETKKLLGEIYEYEGNSGRAMELYEEVIKTDPKNLFVIKRLSKIYMHSKNWDKAISNFRSALENYPNEPFLLDGIADLLISCPEPKFLNIDEGKEFAERAFINYKSTIPIKLSAGKTLATAYAVSGDINKATEYMNLTIALAKKENLSQNLIPYFETLRRNYNLL